MPTLSDTHRCCCLAAGCLLSGERLAEEMVTTLNIEDAFKLYYIDNEVRYTNQQASASASAPPRLPSRHRHALTRTLPHSHRATQCSSPRIPYALLSCKTDSHSALVSWWVVLKALSFAALLLCVLLLLLLQALRDLIYSEMITAKVGDYALPIPSSPPPPHAYCLCLLLAEGG